MDPFDLEDPFDLKDEGPPPPMPPVPCNRIAALSERIMTLLELALGRPRLDQMAALRASSEMRKTLCSKQEVMGRVWDENNTFRVQNLKDEIIAGFLADIASGMPEGEARQAAFARASEHGKTD